MLASRERDHDNQRDRDWGNPHQRGPRRGRGQRKPAGIAVEDPFGLQRQDRDKVVAALRAQRARWEEAEAQGGSKPKATKVTSNAVQSLLTQKKAGDLGL